MIKDLKISMFKGPIQNVIDPKEITVEQMINLMIKPPKILKEQIEKIKLITDKELRDKEKRNLPYYTVTGLFDIFREDQIDNEEKERKYVGHKRRKTICFIPESYTHIIPIDIDKSKNNDFDVDEVFKKIKGIPGIFFIIKSPSGKGIKALMIVKDNYQSETHRRVCKELIYPSIEKHIGCKLDESQATLTQALYYTTGEYYLNWNTEPLEIDINNLKPIKDYKNNKDVMSLDNYDEQFFSMPEQLFRNYTPSLPLLHSYQYFTDNKIKRLFYLKYKDLYRGESLLSKLTSFETFDNYVNSKTFGETVPNFIKKSHDDDDEDIDTPFIPERVFNKLPKYLKDLCSLYDDDKRRRDILLLSELTILSTIFNDVYTLYFNEKIYPNLFLFVTAGAASGKSAMKMSKTTLYKYLENERSENEMKKLENQLASNEDPKFKKSFKKEVELKNHLISADNSYPSMIEQLFINEGKGLIFSTEADSLTKNIKTDWGDLSTGLRFSFQNEEIHLKRKTIDYYIEKSKMGVCVSGTNEQFVKLIPNSENGLFSRFMNYTFEKDIKIEKKLFSSKNEDFEKKIIKDYSEELFRMFNFFLGKEIFIDGTSFNEKLHKELTILLEDTSVFTSTNFSDVVFRHGTITAKILIILTIVRFFQDDVFLNSGKIPETLIPKDEDFEITLDIMRTIINHSEIIFRNISTDKTKFKKNDYKKQIYKKLNCNFTRQDVLIAFKNHGKEIPTADRWIKELKNMNRIETLGKGEFIKLR